MFAQNIQKILVSTPLNTSNETIVSVIPMTDIVGTGIKEVVTLTSDLSRKNLEKDFERMDTPQGTFYRRFHPSDYIIRLNHC